MVVESHVHTLGEKVTATVTYTGSGAAVVSAASLAEKMTIEHWQIVGIVGGLVIALAGFLFNAWLGWRRDQREANRRGGS